MAENTARATPKDFFLWAGILITLYWSVIAFIGLLFAYINFAYPDPLTSSAINLYQGGIGFQMASLIVFFPIFLLLMYIARRDIARDPAKEQVWVRKWALFLTLFVAGMTMLIDLVWLLSTFFSGNTVLTAFVLKSVVLFLIAAVGFMHFTADIRGYWKIYPARARVIAYATSVLVLFSIIAGFLIAGTPQHARLQVIDQQKITDLQTLSSDVLLYWQNNQTLPATLADLSQYTPPLDSQPGDSYTYKKTGVTNFQVCADFNLAGVGNESDIPLPAGGNPSDTNWQHGSGETCFDRTVPGVPSRLVNQPDLTPVLPDSAISSSTP